MIKTISFAYLPPRGTFCADEFRQNLLDYPPSGELILFSDDDWGRDVIRLKGSPESLKHAVFEDGPHKGKPNPFAVHNIIFLAGLKMCRERGATHVLYLEQDCRVGCPGWDGIIFEEYFNIGHPCIVAGTVSVYNPANAGAEALRRFRDFCSVPPRHGIPTPSYGWFGANTQGPSCAFPNGALAVYDMSWMMTLFNIEQQAMMASQNTAFDMAIGAKLWDLFSEDAYQVIGSLSSVYSGYGDVLTTEDERKQLLTSGKVVGIHQIKSKWVPPLQTTRAE